MGKVDAKEAREVTGALVAQQFGLSLRAQRNVPTEQRPYMRDDFATLYPGGTLFEESVVPLNAMFIFMKQEGRMDEFRAAIDPMRRSFKNQISRSPLTLNARLAALLVTPAQRAYLAKTIAHRQEVLRALDVVGLRYALANWQDALRKKERALPPGPDKDAVTGMLAQVKKWYKDKRLLMDPPPSVFTNEANARITFAEYDSATGKHVLKPWLRALFLENAEEAEYFSQEIAGYK